MNPLVPRNLFPAPKPDNSEKLFWEAVVCGSSSWGNFAVGFPAPEHVTHMRLWAHMHIASQLIARVIVYGDEDRSLVAEYGDNGRNAAPGFLLSDWTAVELSTAVTLAVQFSAL